MTLTKQVLINLKYKRIPKLTIIFVLTAQFLQTWAQDRQDSNTWELSNYPKVKNTYIYTFINTKIS